MSQAILEWDRKSVPVKIEKAEAIVAATDTTAATVLQPPYPFLKSTKKLLFVDDDVEAGVRYFYRVRGVNATGAGAWSEPVSRVQ